MQIVRTKRPAPASKQARATASPTTAPKPVEPQDSSRISAGHQTGVSKAVQWTEDYSKVSGGVIGAALTIPAVYAGLIGGSVAGAIAGMSVGPAMGVIQGAKGLELVGKVFSTGGTVAKGFMVVGAAAGLVGGWMTGRRVGEYVAAVPLSVAAYPVGFAQGFVSREVPEKPEQPPKDGKSAELVKRPHGFTKGVAGLVGGVGAISAGIGGAAIGAGAAGGASLVAGLIAGNVDFASLGSAAIIGGGTGLALGGFVGGLGGSTIVTSTADAMSWAKNKIAPDKEGQELEDLRKRISKKQENFEALSTRLDVATDKASAEFTERQKDLEERQADTKSYVQQRDSEVQELHRQGVDYQSRAEDKLNQRQSALDKANNEVERRIEADAKVRFEDKRAVTDAQYAKLHGELDEVRDAHQARDNHITKIEGEQAAEIEAKVVNAYNEKMVPVNARYENLHKEQDNRETELQAWDKKVTDENAQLDRQIMDKGLADFKQREPGLERDFAGREQDLRNDYQGKTNDADADHKQRISQAGDKFQSDKSAADRRHRDDMQQADTDHSRNLREERDNHQSAMSNEARRHEQSMTELDRNFQNKIDRLESGHRSRMATLAAKQTSLQSDKSSLQREKPNLERQLSQAQRDLRDAQQALREIESRWDREVGQAERERNEAVSERNQVSRELSQTESEISQAENEKAKWVRQKAQVDALIPGLRSERDRLQKILDKMD